MKEVSRPITIIQILCSVYERSIKTIHSSVKVNPNYKVYFAFMLCEMLQISKDAIEDCFENVNILRKTIEGY